MKKAATLVEYGVPIDPHVMVTPPDATELELEPGHQGATEALARLLLDRGEATEALALLARVPETPAARALAAQARLIESGVNVSVADDAEVESMASDADALQRVLHEEAGVLERLQDA